MPGFLSYLDVESPGSYDTKRTREEKREEKRREESGEKKVRPFPREFFPQRKWSLFEGGVLQLSWCSCGKIAGDSSARILQEIGRDILRERRIDRRESWRSNMNLMIRIDNRGTEVL